MLVWIHSPPVVIISKSRTVGHMLLERQYVKDVTELWFMFYEFTVIFKEGTCTWLMFCILFKKSDLKKSEMLVYIYNFMENILLSAHSIMCQN